MLADRNHLVELELGAPGLSPPRGGTAITRVVSVDDPTALVAALGGAAAVTTPPRDERDRPAREPRVERAARLGWAAPVVAAGERMDALVRASFLDLVNRSWRFRRSSGAVWRLLAR